MVELGHIASRQRGALNHADAAQAGRAVPTRGLKPLASMSRTDWNNLAGRAIEPNGYHLADWELAVDAFATGRTGASALASWSTSPAASTPVLNGLVPVVSFWRAYRIPLSVLVSADPYGTLGTPLLDRGAPLEAAGSLLKQARDAGARALLLRDVALDGKALAAFTTVLAREDLRPRLINASARACLDATQDADLLLQSALGSKKLKELRRQRRRLADHGRVEFAVARTPDEVSRAVETLLTLEASGWKGQRGTALLQRAGDSQFIRAAAPMLAKTGACEIVSLHAGATPVAAAIVVRHQDRAFYFKMGIDEAFAKFSPGVQLTLDLTRHLCADPFMATADSTADAGHTMIEPIWRNRLRIGDVLLPLYRHDPTVAIAHAALATRIRLRDVVRRLRPDRNRRSPATYSAASALTSADT
ncbi:MAG: GNAT family N-acetyltransferase [Xanthobacteraceae bacterium]